MSDKPFLDDDLDVQSLAEWEKLLKDDDLLQREKFFKYIRSRARRTWDLKSLNFDYGPLIPIFVYDSLMRTREDSNILENFCYLGEATTTTDEWILMKNHENIMMFPYLEKMKDDFSLTNVKFRRVQGEVYGVPLDMIMNLDNMFMCGTEYSRWETSVNLHQYLGQVILLKHVPTYIGIYDHWKKLHDTKKNEFLLDICPTRGSKHNNGIVYRGYSDNPPPLVATGQAVGDLFESSFPYGMNREADEARWRDNWMM